MGRGRVRVGDDTGGFVFLISVISQLLEGLVAFKLGWGLWVAGERRG